MKISTTTLLLAASGVAGAAYLGHHYLKNVRLQREVKAKAAAIPRGGSKGSQLSVKKIAAGPLASLKKIAAGSLSPAKKPSFKSEADAQLNDWGIGSLSGTVF